MCQIIITNRKLKIKELKKNWKQNNDGAGFIYNGRIYKGFMSLGDLIKTYKKVVKENKKHIIHFRKSTSGKINKENTQPFVFEGHYALFHNGTISWLKDEKKSDTRLLAELILNSKNFKKVLGLLSKNSSNKFVVYDLRNNKIWTFGNFYKKDGLLYSSYPFSYYYDYFLKEYIY